MISLHNHSDFSIGDSINSIQDIVASAKQNNQSAIALTDHGTIGGFVEFISECKKNNVKPIVGMEAYIVYDLDPSNTKRKYWHCVLLAKNTIGLQNLIALSSRSYQKGYYYRPRILLSWLRQRAAGLICTTACRGGLIAPDLDADERKSAAEVIRKFKDIFDHDHFYGEIQIIEDEGHDLLNRKIIRECEKFDIPIIATADAHYKTRKDWQVHDVFIKIRNPKFGYTSHRLWLKNEDEMHRDNKKLNHVSQDSLEVFLANTDKIGSMIESYDLPKSDIFKIAITQDDVSEFKRLVTESWNKLKSSIASDKHNKYQERIDYEINTIVNAGFASYFLLVRNTCNFADTQGIVRGIGRGSSVGCMCSYLLNITKLDPIKYDLIFERFLNPGRLDPERAKVFGAALPDIDLDFQSQKREAVRQHLFDTNPGRAIPIGTYSEIGLKAGIKDVAKFLGKPFFDINIVTKKIDATKTLDEAIAESSEFAEWYRNNQDWIDKFVRPLVGKKRHEGIHAAGVAISSRPLKKLLPVKTMLDKETKDRIPVAQLNDKDCEKLGLVKLDILGLTALDLEQRCLQLIRIKHKKKIDLNKISTKDKSVIANYKNGRVCGVFQFDTDTSRKLLQTIPIDRFEDLIAFVALDRPAILDANLHTQWADRKCGREPIEYDHPNLEQATKDTYGIILYQEQLIKAVMAMGNMSAIDADLFRVATGKKDKDLMAKELEKFITSCVANGVKKSVAKKVADKLEKFAGYSFNKSHASAYAMVGYRAMWLKTHYPLEFFGALFQFSDREKFSAIRTEALSFGIELKLPVIGISGLKYRIKNNKIYMPISAIKGAGDKLATQIYKTKPKTIEDLLQIEKRILNIAKFSLLYAAKALEFIDKNKQETLELACDRYGIKEKDLLDRINKIDVDALYGFVVSDTLEDFKNKFPKLKALDSLAKVKGYSNGSCVTALGVIKSVRQIVTKRGQEMAFVSIEDVTAKLTVIFWPEDYATFKDELVIGSALLTNATKDGDCVKNIERNSTKIVDKSQL